MKKTKFLALLLVAVMVFSVITACTKKGDPDQPGGDQPGGTVTEPGGTTTPDEKPAEQKLEPITFTMFVAGPGEAPPKDNKIVKKLQEITGVTIDFEFLVGDMEQKVGIMIASGDYPDLIGAGQARGRFLNAGSFAAVDDYLPNYPNLWKHYEPYLDTLRSVSADNKIYILDIWGRQYRLEDGQDDFYEGDYNGPAFWTQKDVLAWDGYSYPKTLDAYFDLLERYFKAHPTIDGQPTLGFEVHSQDWRSFCLKNAPQHLIGGRNEGDVVVHPDTLKVEIYQNKWYAKEYYKKLNEVFKKGLIHPETFSRNYDNYLSVISTGRVLGMFDQQWNFQDGESVLVSEGKIERTYVPLGISLDGSDVPYNRVRSEGIIGGNGMGISVKCKDIERALQFMDTLLEEDVHRLMYWGIEGEDYYVDENGRYRRTPEQKANFDNPDWRLANSGAVIGDQFPKLEGRYSNGNSCGAGTQPEERLENQFPYDKEFYSKYGFYSKSDFLPLMDHPGYPEVWSIFSTMEEDNIAKPIFDEITDLQNRYLPGVIMSDNFDAAWDEYVARYENVNYKALEEEIERQIQARLTKR
ncbi:MAG: extracellular solute-binding protein [Acetivibrionales bacterium]|nr:extracellular solute-binding protein [Clostridiales bacterium]HPZ04918.1 extracellular solute-binding protein [Clostridiales bacterium]